MNILQGLPALPGPVLEDGSQLELSPTDCAGVIAPGAIGPGSVREVDRITEAILIRITETIVLDLRQIGHGQVLSTFSEGSKWKSSGMSNLLGGKVQDIVGKSRPVKRWG